jgi:zinc transporter ZupT
MAYTVVAAAAAGKEQPAATAAKIKTASHTEFRTLPMQALTANFISAATILPGGLLAYYLSAEFDITFLLSFAAGNFIYIAASDLIPEVKHHRLLHNTIVHFGAFVGGILVIVGTRVMTGG